MESAPVDNPVSSNPTTVPSDPTQVKETPSEVPAQIAETAAPVEVEDKAVEKEEKEEAAPEENEIEEEEEEEEEEEVPEPEEEEWVSEEEVAPRRRGRRYQSSDSDEDEEYGRSKRRKIVPPKKAPRTRVILANEPAGMKALRQYTSALKLGPRCFRGLNVIMNVKEREATLISRLHEYGRNWAGEYPTREEIMLAKEETRQKKAEKARQYIIEEEDGVRTSRKAAQKARDFVKNMGEDEEDEGVIDEEVEPDIEDNRDEE